MLVKNQKGALNKDSLFLHLKQSEQKTLQHESHVDMEQSWTDTKGKKRVGDWMTYPLISGNF